MQYFSLIFALPFIGGPIAMLTILWDDTGFGSPPLAMKLFGTFVCLAVMFVGVAMAYGIIAGKRVGLQKGNHTPVKHNKRSYSCEHCGASIGAESEISPSGDVKCEYCNSWFDINNT